MPDSGRSWLRLRFDRHGISFGVFLCIGGFVFLLGSAILFFAVEILGMSPTVAFFVQSVISVEASFFLNWRLTWRDRAAALWPALLRFNAIKALTIPLNQVTFMLLLALGAQYLFANVLTVAVFTLINYATCRLWAFPVSSPALR